MFLLRTPLALNQEQILRCPQVVALLTFRSLEDFQNAVQAHGQEILDDIPNFTSVQPIVQITEDLT